MSLGRLGDFFLERPLGRGAMGRVYAARHARSGEAVAVKVLGETPGPAALSELRRELHAMAALHHPHILVVYDHGVCGEEDAGPAPVGAPWLAVEKASLGSLAMRPPGDWDGVRAVLEDLLDALAHAHAHGVIHRDLKLANVLVCGEEDRRPGLKLGDFGVAWSLGSEGPQVAGSPHTMAPEQAAGAVWALGPGTDLYALGALAWELVTGRPVFADRTDRDLRLAHRHEPPPELEPRMRVPRELEAWLCWLLAKHPGDRPALAADAAHALAGLGPAVLPASGGAQQPVGSRSSATFTFSDSGQDAAAWRAAPEGRARPQAPFPATWVRDEPPFPLHLIHGAGASLFGLRPVPFVGRRAEREALWAALARAVAEQAPQVVRVEGPEGIGATRVVAWMGRRAESLGAARVWRGGSGGIVGLLAEVLGVAGLPQHVWPRALEGEAHAEVLLAALSGEHPDPVGVAMGLLARRAAVRPVWLHLDDVHRQPGLRALAERVAGAPELGPVLLAAVTHPAEPVLAELPGERLTLPPLDREAMGALLRGALGLAAHVVGTLEVRAGGHPGFALDLVRDWVHDGVLAPTEDGFAPPEARLLAVPDDTRLWQERLDGVLPRFSPEAAEAGWIAAAIGPRVEEVRWRQVTERLGEVWTPEAMDELVARGLASRHPEGWSLAHPLLREAWLRTRPDAARTARLAQVAALLDTLADESLHAGRLWLEARRPDRAHPSLWRGARAALATRRYAVAEAALERREAALDALGLPAEHALRTDGRLLRMRVLGRAGKLAPAMALAEALAASPPEERRAEILAHCGKTAFTAGQWERAEAWLAEAPAGDAETERLRGELAWQHAHDLEGAREHAERALALALAAEDAHQAGAAANDLGNIARECGELEAAIGYFEQSLAHTAGSRDAVVVALNLAWLDLDRGRAAEAHARLGEVQDELEAVFDRYLLVGAVSMRAFSAATVGDAPGFDRAIARCRSLWPLVIRHAHNTAPLLLQAAARWRERGDAGRAALAHRMGEEVCAELAPEIAAKLRAAVAESEA